MNTIRQAGLVIVVQVLAAVSGVLISLYLTATKLAGGVPACLPGGGCETVALSEYSSIFGIPVALLGFAFSVATLLTLLAWLRRRDRRLLYATYAMALFGVVFVAYLTYLELFVIRAICQWCVGYAISMVVLFGATAVTVGRSRS